MEGTGSSPCARIANARSCKGGLHVSINALETEPTGMLENHPAIAGKMLHIGEPVTLGAEQSFEPSLSLKQRSIPVVLTI